MRTLEQLQLGYARVQAAETCRNIMADYKAKLAAGSYAAIPALYTDSAVLQLPWGRYTGKAAIEKCFRDHADLFPADRVNLGGIDSEVLEVAGDGQTARGAWVSMGTITTASQGDARWCWGKYAVDFILEDGSWKIWHMVLFPLYLNRYEVCWSDEKPLSLDDFPFTDVDRTGALAYVWGPDSVTPGDQPEPPLPYETWTDDLNCVKG